MRLIDADAVAEAIKDEITEAKGIDADPNFTAGLKLGLAYVNTAPTVDAVPVVRCKDCAYYEYSNAGDFCSSTGAGMPEDGYCSDGERKAEP